MLTLRYDESMGQLLQESSRALLNLTSALQADSTLFEKVYPDPKSVKLDAATITQVLQMESIIPPNRETLQKTIPLAEVASENDLVIGRLLRLSVLQDPSLSKGWNKLADWAYQMGQQVVENAAKSNNKVPLTPEELETLDKLIPNIAESSKKKIINIISQVKLKDSHLAGYEYEKWDFMRRDLREVNALMSVDDDIFQGIIGLWISVFRRTYALYDLAGEAYFKYLSLCGETPASGTISASLRLLHLTVNHTMELQDIQLGLSKTPSTQWKAIIPQLFSRLNHPVPVVRQRISDLLCRISAKYPELIIFPAVVGSLTTGAQTSETLTNIFSGTLLNKETVVTTTSDQETEGQSNVLMLSAHQKIVEELKKVMPTAVDQVSSFVSELRRITLLWDELWLGTLAQYSGEVQRRINRFEQESGRLESNSSLTVDDKLKLVKDKYNIVFTPIIYVLDQVAAITKSSPETPHEEEFQRKYGTGIDTLLEGIKNPEDWGTPCKAWSYLPQLQARLNSRVNKKSALKLAEISPSLYSMRNTEIMMPGDLGGKEHSVQIARFEGTMTVLPTKTKPKKFSLIGTDGGRYTYLFKGLEDLHLDERIMQFLGIANQMLSKNKRERDVKYFARNYTVIPLGSRSGLIQWVEGAMPIFALYKRWQLRQQQHLENAKKLEDAAKVVGKPSDIFYAKILPILRKHGVSKIEDRKSWPISLLKQVLHELVQETPRDLLGNQVWLRSVSGEQWWKIIQNLGRSFAVMSIIGYIIGLGDRHLDNILVNLDQGYVVHIDYNICFEKGKILRIPERVPCRLTQNIVSVLGVSGVEGLFRLGCERTLSVMREERETLLTLLEAFVYDPLVDWTTGITGGLAGAMYGGGGAQEENEKREMEHSLTFSMLGVRVTEMKGAWLENKHDLQAALMQVDEGLSSWQELVTISQKNGEQLSVLHTNMSTLKEAEVNPGHRLYSILDTYRKLWKEGWMWLDVVKNQLQSFISECDKILTLYNRATASVSGPQLSKWDQEAGRLLEQNQILSSRTVSTFLENAGQREQLAQYVSVEKDMRIRMTGLLDELKRILEDLHVYSALTRSTNIYANMPYI
ncbi:serine/threonine-protein kinase SMG1 [Eurytemora carolleeae]|uniref:serine/threonine-protein kinase SMG1 n=1 Tax=Eurytemora carolleeae TaxID=1294199 RepID=UPI000C790259|nr:serine/threonine-protein kinase SMG1 [Eurytemora carolleeae]|eukprot:XP_023332658.1 serine/threonine-protein kinase SMG1-like [Eurytemora affinis]